MKTRETAAVAIREDETLNGGSLQRKAHPMTVRAKTVRSRSDAQRGQSLRVRRLVRRLERLSKIADEKVAAIGGWTTRLPSKRGLWFHAVWQKAGCFHVQRHPLDSSLRYLRRQAKTVWPGARQHWCGPFTAEQATEKWTWHVNPPLRQS